MLAQSLEHYERALAIAHEMGHRHEAARVHSQIASIYATTGDVEQALAHWRRALELFDDPNSPEACEVAAKLRQQD